MTQSQTSSVLLWNNIPEDTILRDGRLWRDMSSDERMQALWSLSYLRRLLPKLQRRKAVMALWTLRHLEEYDVMLTTSCQDMSAG